MIFSGSTSGSVSMSPGSKARNGAQSDLLAQLLSSLGKFRPYETLFHFKDKWAGVREELPCLNLK